MNKKFKLLSISLTSLVFILTSCVPSTLETYELYNLGVDYYFGRGVEQNYETAIRYHQLAADQGDNDSKFYLGYMHEFGEGVEQNYETAARYYQEAANQGLSRAQNNLGEMYENGYGVEQDYETAIYWYKLATNQGNDYGQNNLGRMYENGYGVEQDYQTAVRYYQLSANQGNAEAQTNLEDLQKIINRFKALQQAEAEAEAEIDSLIQDLRANAIDSSSLSLDSGSSDLNRRGNAYPASPSVTKFSELSLEKQLVLLNCYQANDVTAIFTNDFIESGIKVINFQLSNIPESGPTTLDANCELSDYTKNNWTKLDDLFYVERYGGNLSIPKRRLDRWNFGRLTVYQSPQVPVEGSTNFYPVKARLEVENNSVCKVMASDVVIYRNSLKLTLNETYSGIPTSFNMEPETLNWFEATGTPLDKDGHHEEITIQLKLDCQEEIIRMCEDLAVKWIEDKADWEAKFSYRTYVEKPIPEACEEVTQLFDKLDEVKEQPDNSDTPSSTSQDQASEFVIPSLPTEYNLIPVILEISSFRALLENRENTEFSIYGIKSEDMFEYNNKVVSEVNCDISETSCAMEIGEKLPPLFGNEFKSESTISEFREQVQKLDIFPQEEVFRIKLDFEVSDRSGSTNAYKSFIEVYNLVGCKLSPPTLRISIDGNPSVDLTSSDYGYLGKNVLNFWGSESIDISEQGLQRSEIRFIGAAINPLLTDGTDSDAIMTMSHAGILNRKLVNDSSGGSVYSLDSYLRGDIYAFTSFDKCIMP